jgi:hypothetical protein
MVKLTTMQSVIEIGLGLQLYQPYEYALVFWYVWTVAQRHGTSMLTLSDIAI